MDYIEAGSLSFSELNETIRSAGANCRVSACLGQRFIAAGMSRKSIEIDGIPGNALGAYLNGADITVHGNAQDAVGDTMSAGRIVIHGNIGDAAGYAMRGGEIFVEGNAGYRAGIHMKESKDHKPVIGYFPCTGMHGGKMVFRGDVSRVPFPSQVTAHAATEADKAEFAPYVREYCRLFGRDADAMLRDPYTVVTPDSKNPYKQMYVSD